ncbi:MAG: hypothetical protein Fur0044_13280 [Anaerolineae bacterium]
MSQLRLSLLGPPQVWADDTPLTFATRKALALLIYLAVEGGAQPRDKLLTLLWSDSGPKQGRGVLRTTLAYLRRALDASTTLNSAAYLMTEADTIAFNLKADYNLDLHQVELALQSDQPALLEQAASLYRGDFLIGFSLADAPGFDEWASVQRETWHRRMSAVFEQLSEQQAEERRFEAGLATAARWVAHDPLNEAAHRRLMQLYALKGDRTAALQAYAACQTALKMELSIEPSAETRKLAEQIRRQELGSKVNKSKIENRKSKIPRAKGLLGEGHDVQNLPFVGRSAEYAQLGATYQTVCQGQPRVVLIEGEAGIGKTRLATEFLNWLIFHGADVLRGRAFEAGGRLAYQPITEMIRERIEQENAPDDLLGDVWLAELSRLLPELRERYPDLPPPTADETLAQARLLEALARLGQAMAARRPLVWFIDDAQWADVASLDTLSYLGRVWAERNVVVLLLFSIRTEALLASPALNEWLVALARAAPLTRLNLGPLTAAETWQLVEALQGGKPAGEQGSGGAGERNIPPAPLPPSSPAHFADWLFAETAGQPFYISETLKMLQEQGTLRAQADPAGHWRIDLAGNLPPFPVKGQAANPLIPSGVRQIILARLNRLAPTATALLTAAAVIGRPCRFERLSQVAGLAENESLAALDELLSGRLLLETRQTARPYTVAHDKIRDVVYTEAGAARRLVYHRRAFESLETIAAEQPEHRRRAAELAHHALAAHLVEPAFRYSLAAGDEAMRLFAVRDAVIHYEHAQAVFTGQAASQNLQHLYLQLGRAYELTNEWDKARATYETMLALAQAAHAPEAECAALNRLATLAAQIAYDIDQATAFLQRAIGVAENCGDQVALAEAEWNLAQIRVYIWDIEGSMLHAQRALALARQLDLPELTGRSLTVLGFAENGAARWVESESHYQEARHLYAALGNRALEAESLCGIARARANLGQPYTAIDLVRTAHTFNLESDNAWGQAVSALNLGFVLLEANEWSEALAVAKAGVGFAQAVSGFAPLPILNLTVLGNTYRAMLALEAAQAAHREAIAISESRPHQPLLRMTASEMCVDCGLVGDWEAAYRYARQSLAAHNHSLLHGGLYHWYVTEALLWGGDLTLARADAQRFGRQFGHSRRYQIPYRRCLAVLAQWAGDMGQAIEHLTIANTLAEEMDLPGEQWSILAQLGEFYQAAGNEAKAQKALTRAAEIAQTLAAKIDDEDLRAGFLRGIL